MTDKDMKDYCKNCSVEPPIMRFKCLECEHNPDKEQIMINGVDVRECEHLTYQLEEDGEYYWFCNIAPAGGPDECEYNPECSYKKMFKQLARKTQECEQKEKELKELKHQYKLSCLDCEYKNTKADVERYRKECDFWKHQTELGSETTDRLAKQLEAKEQECENLKTEEKYLKQCCEKAGEELAKHSFEYDGKEKNLVVQAMELNEKYEKLIDQNASLQKQVEDMIEWQKIVQMIALGRACRCSSLDAETAMCKENGKKCIGIVNCRDRYRKALKEIEEIIKNDFRDDYKVGGVLTLIDSYLTENGEFVDERGDFLKAFEDLLDKEYSSDNKTLSISRQILNIINKAKGEE